ncbi:adenosylmethionine decarboxylase [Candidatus Pacearchaeota archaeon]|nr:adenosylmethionine decarboxylase [Candidatus Pacearchaeota archaeon]
MKKGIHIISNFFGCRNGELLVNEKKLKKFLTNSVRKNKLTILKEYFHKFGKDDGITGYLLLAESHVSIHTWPERDNYLSFDIFVCNLNKDNTKNAKKIYKEVIKAFKPRKKEQKILERD